MFGWFPAGKQNKAKQNPHNHTTKAIQGCKALA